MFQVGKHLLLHAGPEFVREIRRRGAEVFLDLKFHDTPRSVCRGAIEATRLGAKMFDLHPYMNLEAMKRTHAEVARLCRAEGLPRPQILAVTILAGLGGGRDGAAGARPAEEAGASVVKLARLAVEAELDGVVTSAREAARLRAACGRRFIVVAAGVHLEGGAEGQPSALGPAEAMRAGADYLIVGSPIWSAAEPARAVYEIACEMERGIRSNQRGAGALFSLRSP